MIKHLKYFSFSSILYFFILLIIHFSFIISSISFEYPSALTLNNGNIFIIHKTGVSICDPSNSTIIKDIIIFKESEQIKNEDYLSKVILAQFKDGYIVSIIINKIFFFDAEGKYEYNETLTTRDDLYYFLTIIYMNILIKILYI